MNPATPGFDLDPLHMVLITGFVSTLVGVVVGTITKSRTEKKYENLLTREEFKSQMEITIREMITRCMMERGKCPFLQVDKDMAELRVSMEREIAEIRLDLQEVKQVQTERTIQLQKRSKAEFNLWRILLDKFKIPVEDQNRLLEGLS